MLREDWRSPAALYANTSIEQLTPAITPDIDPDDLDILDPWVIDGRYAADLPDLGAIEADGLVAAAQRVIDQVRQLMR